MKLSSSRLVAIVAATTVWIALVVRVEAGTTFDGGWAVTLETPEYKDPTGVVSLAYTFNFPAEVKDGLLHGEHGTKGSRPGWTSPAGLRRTATPCCT